MLTQTELQKYKKELEAERTRLMKQVEADSEPHNAGNEVTKVGEEEADEAEDFSDQLAVAQTLRDEVQEIDDALERMHAGKYGICEKCGTEIPRAVLDAAPESAYCENCKRSGAA